MAKKTFFKNAVAYCRRTLNTVGKKTDKTDTKQKKLPPVKRSPPKQFIPTFKRTAVVVNKVTYPSEDLMPKTKSTPEIYELMRKYIQNPSNEEIKFKIKAEINEASFSLLTKKKDEGEDLTILGRVVQQGDRELTKACLERVIEVGKLYQEKPVRVAQLVLSLLQRSNDGVANLTHVTDRELEDVLTYYDNILTDGDFEWFFKSLKGKPEGLRKIALKLAVKKANVNVVEQLLAEGVRRETNNAKRVRPVKKNAKAQDELMLALLTGKPEKLASISNLNDDIIAQTLTYYKEVIKTSPYKVYKNIFTWPVTDNENATKVVLSLAKTIDRESVNELQKQGIDVRQIIENWLTENNKVKKPRNEENLLLGVLTNKPFYSMSSGLSIFDVVCIIEKYKNILLCEDVGFQLQEYIKQCDVSWPNMFCLLTFVKRIKKANDDAPEYNTLLIRMALTLFEKEKRKWASRAKEMVTDDNIKKGGVNLTSFSVEDCMTLLEVVWQGSDSGLVEFKNAYRGKQRSKDEIVIGIDELFKGMVSHENTHAALIKGIKEQLKSEIPKEQFIRFFSPRTGDDSSSSEMFAGALFGGVEQCSERSSPTNILELNQNQLQERISQKKREIINVFSNRIKQYKDHQSSFHLFDYSPKLKAFIGVHRSLVKNNNNTEQFLKVLNDKGTEEALKTFIGLKALISNAIGSEGIGRLKLKHNTKKTLDELVSDLKLSYEQYNIRLRAKAVALEL